VARRAQAEAVRLAELLGARCSRAARSLPTSAIRSSAATIRPQGFEKVTGLQPDLLFLVGCRGVHGSVQEPTIMQIGPNPLLMGRHYPLDVACGASCATRCAA
jgi:hypothetical protein